MGISHETTAKLISAEYEKSGVKGEQYIKKIIQIPIVIQHWNVDDVKKQVQDLLDRKIIATKYSQIIADNIDLIAKAIEPNPREAKRFINNFIVAYEIYGSDKRVDFAVLLVLQALMLRWDSFYRLMMSSNKEFRNDIKIFSELTQGERLALSATSLPQESKRLLIGFNSDYELWHFISENSTAIFGIEDWGVYRRVTETVKEEFASSLPIYLGNILNIIGELSGRTVTTSVLDTAVVHRSGL